MITQSGCKLDSWKYVKIESFWAYNFPIQYFSLPYFMMDVQPTLKYIGTES